MTREFAILIVDDDADLCSNVQDVFEAEGHSTAVAKDGQTALALCKEKVFDLALTDIRLPDISGVELVEKLVEVYPAMEHILITGYASVESAAKAVRHKSIIAYETKPLDMENVLALVRQVTERKQLEEALRESQEQFRTSVENMLDCFGIYSTIRDESGHIVDFQVEYVNKAACTNNRMTREEQVGKRLCELLPAHRETGLFNEYCQVVETGKPLVKESILYEDIYKEQRLIRAFDISAVKLGDGFAVAWRDVTERKRAEEALQESEQNFRNTVDNSSLGITIASTDGRLVYANQAFLDIYGYSSIEELRTVPIEQRFTPESYAKLQGRRERMRLGKAVPANYEISIVRKDGEVRHLAVFRKEVIWGGEKQFQSLYQDVTEHKRAEEKLWQAAEEWRTTFDSITDAVSIHDKDFRIVRVNKAYADVLKMKPQELIGKICYEVVHGTKEPWPVCPHRETLETKKPSRKEFLEPRLGAHVEVTCSPIFNERREVIATVHIIRDITERKQMEEQLLHAQLLASLGEMTAGIAHEVGNPLASILLYSETAMKGDASRQTKKDLKVIRDEAKRAGKLMRDLLAYSHKLQPKMRRFNLHSMIKKVLKMRRYQQKVQNISVSTNLRYGPLYMNGDSSQLLQVFMNLILNAEEALRKSRGGNIIVTTQIDEEWAKVWIADDGTGIPEENLNQVFYPFFTTKQVGKGTGLGLSTCYGIVTGHGGLIRAENNEMGGATFTVELPLAKARR